MTVILKNKKLKRGKHLIVVLLYINLFSPKQRNAFPKTRTHSFPGFAVTSRQYVEN